MGIKKIYQFAFSLSVFVVMLGLLYAIFFYAPTEKTMGLVQKIFYIHLPAAFLAFLAFFITFIASILYLLKKDLRWDVIASSSVEIGIIFCSIVLITGPIWAKPVWNVWWTWDPRLTTTLIMWFIYVAYLMLRSAVSANQGANFAAVFGIIGFVNVPITFLSIRLWRTIHPVLITTQGMHMSAPIKYTLLLSFIAFSLLFIYLLQCRIKLEKMSIDTAEIGEMLEDIYKPVYNKGRINHG